MGSGKSKKKTRAPESSSEHAIPAKVSEIKPAGGDISVQSETEVRALDLSISGEIKTRQSSDKSSPHRKSNDE